MTLATSPAVNAAAPGRTAGRAGWLSWLAVGIAVALAWPVVSVGSNIFAGGTAGTWSHLMATLLPDYIRTTLWLCAGVALMTAVLGVASAWLVTHFEFPLRRSFDWLLVLSEADEAEVVAEVRLLEKEKTVPYVTSWERMGYD